MLDECTNRIQITIVSNGLAKVRHRQVGGSATDPELKSNGILKMPVQGVALLLPPAGTLHSTIQYKLGDCNPS